MRSIRLFVVLATAVAAFACGGADPEAELVQASEAANEARDRVEAARTAVQEREAEVEDVQQKLREARTGLRDALADISGVAEAFPGKAFFNEIPFRATGGPSAVNALRLAAAGAGIAGVLPMGRWYREYDDVFTLACTEKVRPEHIKAFAAVVAETLGRNTEVQV